ncbi:unnamed protein product [Sphagnum jensenii]|uniref:Uncharacterized protein n=1 Tax=Sphagnum jensenii TaxID=128206 RepID=A0ABP1ALB1_9BRYO
MPRQMRSVLLPCDLQASMCAHANLFSNRRDSFNDSSYRYGGFASSGRTSCSNSISDADSEQYLDHWQLFSGFSPPFPGDAPGAYSTASFCNGPESEYCKATGIYGFQTPVSPASATGDDAIIFDPFTNCNSLESTRFMPADLQYLSKPYTRSALLQGSSCTPGINYNFAGEEETVPSQCAAAHKSAPKGSFDFPVTRLHACNNPPPAVPYSATVAWQSPSVSYHHVAEPAAALWLQRDQASETGADAKSSSSVDSANILQFQEHEDVLVLNNFPAANLAAGMHLKTTSKLLHYPNGPSYGIESKNYIEFPAARSSLYKTELCRSWEETGYCRSADLIQKQGFVPTASGAGSYISLKARAPPPLRFRLIRKT